MALGELLIDDRSDESPVGAEGEGEFNVDARELLPPGFLLGFAAGADECKAAEVLPACFPGHGFDHTEDRQPRLFGELAAEDLEGAGAEHQGRGSGLGQVAGGGNQALRQFAPFIVSEILADFLGIEAEGAELGRVAAAEPVLGLLAEVVDQQRSGGGT